MYWRLKRIRVLVVSEPSLPFGFNDFLQFAGEFQEFVEVPFGIGLPTKLICRFLNQIVTFHLNPTGNRSQLHLEPFCLFAK
jgi:hypothetical protein